MQNAYLHNGFWDIVIRNREVTDQEAEEYGLSFVAGEAIRYSAYLGEDALQYVTLAEEENAKKLGGYQLVEGTFPKSEGEIALPYVCCYEGRSPENGTLQVGDQITVMIGERKDENGNQTFSEQKEEEETFEACRKETFVISGFLVYIPLNGTYAATALTYPLADYDADLKYYTLHERSCDQFVQTVLAIGPQWASYHDAVYLAMKTSGEMEDALQKRNGIILLAIAVTLSCAVICGSMLSRRMQERKLFIQNLTGLGMNGRQCRRLFRFV